MKKLTIFFFAAVIFLLQACVDKILDKVPTDQVSMETYWKTENDLKTWVNSFYDMTSAPYNYHIQEWGYNYSNILLGYGLDDTNGAGNYNERMKDLRSDNSAATSGTGTPFMNLRTGTNTIDMGWDQTYKGGWWWFMLRPINLFLENYEKAQIPDATKYQYGGEAAMFRAWFYFDKVEYFGDVPLILKSLDISDTTVFYGPRNPRAEVMAQVLKDINFACEKLPDNWNNGSPGYMNRWAALALKSRICLFEGTWQKYHGGSNAQMWLTEAAAAAKEIIDGGKYAVYNTGHPESDYRYAHHQNDLGGDPEIIYWKRYVVGLVVHPVLAYFIDAVGGTTRSAVEDYLCTDGLPIAKSPLYMGDGTIESVFVNRDPRLRQTVLHPDDAGPGKPLNYANGDPGPYPMLNGQNGYPTTETGYPVIKFYDNDAYINWDKGQNGAIIFGYNEVLLNYAEAKAELGSLTQADLDISINKLRDRVNMPHMVPGNIVHDPSHADQGVSDLIVEIRRERRVELFDDGFRYGDLRRWRTFVKECTKPSSYQGILWDNAAIARYAGANVQTSVDPVSGKTYIDVFKGTSFQNNKLTDSNEKYYLWPLPTSALATDPALGQTPGW